MSLDLPKVKVFSDSAADAVQELLSQLSEQRQTDIAAAMESGWRLRLAFSVDATGNGTVELAIIDAADQCTRLMHVESERILQ